MASCDDQSVKVSHCQISDFVYAIGGSSLSSVIAYDILTGVSKAVSPMCGNRWCACAASSEDEIIVVGGYNDSRRLDTAELFSVSENK